MAQFSEFSKPEELVEVEDVPDFRNASLVLQSLMKPEFDHTGKFVFYHTPEIIYINFISGITNLKIGQESRRLV